jgi:hypothetical protein
MERKRKKDERRRGRRGGGKGKVDIKEGGWAVLGWCHDSPLKDQGKKHAWSNVD